MKNTGKPTEKAFEAAVLALGKGGYFYRIKDAAAIHGLTGKVGHVDETPSDYIVTAAGVTFYAELKSTQHETSFPFSLLKRGQTAHSTRILAAGGEYWVFVQRLPSEEWFRIPMRLIQQVRAAGKSSIPWKDLEPYRWNPNFFTR